ncbi:TonB-dependent siderophore receptor [Sphingobium lactosutens]|uniref:Secretin/TonB short N-terminal domain-containing protein n=1 Tax=Sphingobium lactosutens DS20 TaxID=1331060 RepID=T0HPM3_9SPHN|nr:TonB-dependent siderophore receptor [Sphingobium lactosutens]EQB14987.1 hypothetical protein RLDS_12515 [Sphingobium lactosutens DS20]
MRIFNGTAANGLRGVIASSLLATTALGVSVTLVTPAMAQETRSYDIPAGPLPAVLSRFIEASGVAVVYDAPLAQNAISAGLKGSYGPAEALSRVLAGSGLTYRQTGPGAFTLEPAPTAAAGTIQLGAVRVAGDDQGGNAIATPKTDVAATDRSRSYAARAATVAGKSAQSLLDIPQSVSVITRQRMDDQNIVSLEDALRQTTGVTAVTYGDGTAYFQIRGYPAEVQFDGLPANSAIQYLRQFDLSIYDRVEVLRGPSGLLQGSGEPAGTVNLVRKRPHDRFGWAASLMGGSWNNFHGDFDVTGPLNAAGTIRGRAVVSGQDRDFFTDEAHERHGLAYGILEFDLDPATIFTLSGTIQDQKQAPFDYGPGAYVNGTAVERDRSTFFGVDWAQSYTRTREAYASLDHHFANGWAAKISANYRYQGGNSGYGYVGGLVNLNNSAAYTLQSQSGSREWFGADANVSGPIDLFGRTHELLIGANYAWTDNLSRSGSFGTTVANIFDIAVPERAIPFTYASDARTEQYGAYGQARISLADPLTLVLGGRLTTYRSKTRTGVAQTGPYTNGAEATGHFTPSAGVIWKVTPAISLYGSYSSIFVPQNSLRFSGSMIDPREGDQFEVGAKGALFDGALNLSGALFRLTDNNRAYLDPDHPGTPAYYIAAGKVRSQGIELEASGEPLPGWSLFVGYTYLESKTLKAVTGQGNIFDTEEPKNSFKFWNTYRIGNVDRPGFQIGGGLRAQSKTSRGGPVQSSYAVADVQIGYRLDQQLSATLSVTNLFDKTYFARAPARFYSIYGEPRAFTLTLRKGF